MIIWFYLFIFLKDNALLRKHKLFEENEKLVGKKFAVIIEGKLTDENVYVGRTYRDAPDIDGYCFIKSDKDLVLGDTVNVKIEKASGYDLIASEV